MKEKEIISERNVEDFRCYIRNKNVHASKLMLSSVLADALHRALDAKLEQFAHGDRKRIRDTVIRNAAEKERFSVDGAEVFHACIALEDTGEAFRESLTQWVCLNQPVEVDRQWVERVIEQLREQDQEETYSDQYIEVLLDESEEEAVATVENTAVEPEKSTYFPGKTAIRYALLAVLTTAAAVSLFFAAGVLISPKQSVEVQIVSVSTETQEKAADEIGYVAVDEALLKEWLGRRDSLLAEEPYFSSIMKAAKHYDVHPLLMFAITGQEQAFVPKSNRHSKKMANNPFNVYGSWEKYNTDIQDSAALAAGLIANSTKSKPEEEDIIRWINKKYAEDPEWWIHVTLIFEKMKREILPSIDNQL